MKGKRSFGLSSKSPSSFYHWEIKLTENNFAEAVRENNINYFSECIKVDWFIEEINNLFSEKEKLEIKIKGSPKTALILA